MRVPVGEWKPPSVTFKPYNPIGLPSQYFSIDSLDAVRGHNPLRSSAGTPSGAASPVGNINRPVTIQELLADLSLVPGMKGT